MTTELHYKIVERDGGYAFKIADTFSETYPTRDAARAAAEQAAIRHQAGHGKATGQVEGDARRWHDEMSRNDDRPETDIIKDSAHRY